MPTSQSLYVFVIAVIASLLAPGCAQRLSVPRQDDIAAPQQEYQDHSPRPQPTPIVAQPLPPQQPLPEPDHCVQLAGQYRANESEHEFTQERCKTARWVENCALPAAQCRERGIPLIQVHEYVADGIWRGSGTQSDGTTYSTRAYYEGATLVSETLRVSGKGKAARIRERFFRLNARGAAAEGASTLYLAHELALENEGETELTQCERFAPL